MRAPLGGIRKSPEDRTSAHSTVLQLPGPLLIPRVESIFSPAILEFPDLFCRSCGPFIPCGNRPPVDPPRPRTSLETEIANGPCARDGAKLTPHLHTEACICVKGEPPTALALASWMYICTCTCMDVHICVSYSGWWFVGMSLSSGTTPC